MTKTAFIFINGNFGQLDFVKEFIEEDDLIIGCDGGVDRIYELGLKPNMVVGDLDSAKNIPREIKSIKPNKEEYRIVNNIKYYIFPTDKYFLDTELAIDKALEQKPDKVIIINPNGDELDHVIGTLFLLSKQKYLEKDINIITFNQIIYYKETSFKLNGKIGDKVSLMPINGEVSVTASSGLKYDPAVNKMRMQVNSGISNQLTATEASVNTESGGFLVVQHQSPTKDNI